MLEFMTHHLLGDPIGASKAPLSWTYVSSKPSRNPVEDPESGLLNTPITTRLMYDIDQAFVLNPCYTPSLEFLKP